MRTLRHRMEMAANDLTNRYGANAEEKRIMADVIVRECAAWLRDRADQELEGKNLGLTAWIRCLADDAEC